MGPTPHEPLQTPEDPLVTGSWLQANLDDPRVRVLDVRGRHPSSPLPHAKHVEYAISHIPGAVFVNWEQDFVDVDDPVPVQVADAEMFGRRASELGFGDEDLLITYDDYYGIFAARVAWAFRYYGGRSDVLTVAGRRGSRKAARSATRVSSCRPRASRPGRGRGCAAR